MAAITASKHLSRRRDRTYPRVIKRIRRAYRLRQPGDTGTRHDRPPTIKLASPRPLILAA